jgi:hypothetical protein
LHPTQRHPEARRIRGIPLNKLGHEEKPEDPRRNVPLVEKLNMKYLGTLDHPIAKMLMENASNGIAGTTSTHSLSKNCTTVGSVAMLSGQLIYLPE